ncbi:MAG: RNA polymerase sigma factor [Acidimicrobiia bacterium]|nr:RNA polymerase sigma factor [Acidimicrobiia bacterium]
MPNEIVIERAKKDNKNALNDVIIKSSPYVYDLCQKWCRPPIESEDITQVALIKIANNIKDFRYESKFSTWIYTLTYRVFLDEYRKVKRRQSIAPIVSLENTTYISQEAEVQDDSSEQLIDLLEQLSKEHRTILILIDVEKLSYGEASDTLNIEVGTVRSRLARARISFRKLLEEQGTILRPESVKVTKSTKVSNNE